MPRRSTGSVVERRTKRGGVFALRFRAAGERRYETLGTDEEGWNRRRAEDELAADMAAVRRARGRREGARAPERAGGGADLPRVRVSSGSRPNRGRAAAANRR